MGNILTATVAIKGIRPLLWHHFGPDALPLVKQERAGVAGHDPEEWRKTVLKTKEGQLYIDQSYIFACIRDGSKYTKKGRGSIQSAVSATLQVFTDRVLIDRYLPENITELVNETDELVYLDVRSVRNPSTKGRNIRYRVAANSGWKSTFEIFWDKTVVSRNEMQASIIDAGKLSGIGDGRNIGFGRFIMESIVFTEDKQNAEKTTA